MIIFCLLQVSNGELRLREYLWGGNTTRVVKSLHACETKLQYFVQGSTRI